MRISLPGVLLLAALTALVAGELVIEAFDGTAVALGNPAAEPVAYLLTVVHFGHAPIVEVGVINGGDTLDLPLALALAPGCNLIGIMEAGGARALYRLCGLGGAPVAVACSAYEWLDNVGALCAARVRADCEGTCCANTRGCCTSARNVSGVVEWADAPSGAYDGSIGATNWTLTPWTEDAPDDGLPNMGRITSVTGGLRLACDPLPTFGCVLNLPIIVRRPLLLPVCAGNGSFALLVEIQYSGPPAVLSVGNASRALNNGSAGWTVTALAAVAVGGAAELVVRVPVTNCTQPPFVIHAVRVTGDCGPQIENVSTLPDICGVCGGNTTSLAACAIGTLACAPPHIPLRSAVRAWRCAVGKGAW